MSDRTDEICEGVNAGTMVRVWTSDGDGYIAEQSGNDSAGAWYVRYEDGGRTVFRLSTKPTPDELRTFVSIYRDGRHDGHVDGERYGAEQVRAQVHRLLGIDGITDVLRDIAASLENIQRQK